MTSALSEKAIKGALRRNKGLLTLAAWDLGVPPELLRARVANAFCYVELIDEIRCEVDDEALWTVMQRIDAGDVRVAMWWLERFAGEGEFGRSRPTFEVLNPPEKLAALQALAECLAELKLNGPSPVVDKSLVRPA